jgi:hypothetical protein
MHMSKRKRVVRSAISDRCDMLADQILTMNLPKEILVNSLKDLFIDGRTEGYLQQIKDSSSFRRAKEKTIAADWDFQKTALDDRIHGHAQLTNK